MISSVSLQVVILRAFLESLKDLMTSRSSYSFDIDLVTSALIKSRLSIASRRTKRGLRDGEMSSIVKSSSSFKYTFGYSGSLFFSLQSLPSGRALSLLIAWISSKMEHNRLSNSSPSPPAVELIYNFSQSIYSESSSSSSSYTEFLFSMPWSLRSYTLLS